MSLLQATSIRANGYAQAESPGGRMTESEGGTQWYLLRSKTGQERRAHEHVKRIARDTLLPFTQVRVRRGDHIVTSVTPLFACYLFAQLDFEGEYHNLRYTRGLCGVVSFAGEPATVPEQIIGELQSRCAGGPIELPERRFLSGERVRILEGPFREFEGIFERYLSGPERVAVLLSVMGVGARAVSSSSMIVAVH